VLAVPQVLAQVGVVQVPPELVMLAQVDQQVLGVVQVVPEQVFPHVAAHVGVHVSPASVLKPQVNWHVLPPQVFPHVTHVDDVVAQQHVGVQVGAVTPQRKPPEHVLQQVAVSEQVDLHLLSQVAPETVSGEQASVMNCAAATSVGFCGDRALSAREE
jgi:hypothetical protein